MSLGGILILVLLVISLFVFIYLIVITARSWGVLHTILLCFLFIECWTFLFFTAQVLDRRLASLKDFTTTRDRVISLKKDVHRLTWGGDNIGEEQEALVPLSGTVRRLTADRGRVWRNVTKLNVEGEQIRLELSAVAPPPVPGAEDPNAVTPVDPTAAPAAAAPAVTATIPLNMVVYAFSQIADAQNHPIPQVFLGEFRVAESAAGQVLLRPISPLEPTQIKARDDESTWSLYELLPQDSHETFAADGSQPSEEAAFGLMDEQMLNTLFADVPETDGRRQRLVTAYLRDGQQAIDTDPPRNVWLQVEVVKPLEMDVDSEEQANATVGGYFDASGRTVDVRIKRGEKKVTLPEGVQLMMPQDRANESIARGEVKLIKPIYARPLNAYEKGLGQLKLRRDEVSRLIDVTNRESAVLQEANDQGQATKQRYIESQRKLAADQEKYSEEVALVGKELQVITDKYQQMRHQMIQFYQTIHTAHDRLVQGSSE